MSAIKQVDVVISSVGFQQLKDQINIIAAIKEAGGHIKVIISLFCMLKVKYVGSLNLNSSLL